MAETSDEYLDQHGRPDSPYPVIDPDSADGHRHTVSVAYAGGNEKTLVQFMRPVAGRNSGQLGLDVHPFVDDPTACSGVSGRENGTRRDGVDETALGRCHRWPAVDGGAVLIGVHADITAQD